jgi:type IV secretory pathway VirB4 component
MDTGKPQNSVYGPYKFLDNHAYVAKAGELVLFSELQGIDGECRTDEEMESQHSRLLTALVSLPEEIRVITYLVKLEGATITPTEHSNPAVKQTAERRAAFLEAKDRAKPLSTMRLYLALVYEPQRALGINMDSSVMKLSRKKVNAGRRSLYSGFRMLEETVNDLLGLRLLEKAEVFGYLRFLASLDPEVAKAEPLQYDNNLDVHLAANMLTIEPQGIRNHTTRPEVLTLRKLPKRSSAGMMRKCLSVPGNLIVCCQWKREPNDKALKRLRSAEGHWNLVKVVKSWQAAAQLMFQQGNTAGIEYDQAAVKKVEEVNAAICALADKVQAWQNFTAITWGKESGTAATQLMSIVGNYQGSLMRETSYACGPYLSLVPGTTPKHKDKFRKRARQWELGQCLDMGMFYNHWSGNAENKHLNREHMLDLETVDHTLFRFNMHEDDLLGVLIFGRMGTGKSFFTNLCIDHSQKYNPWTFILDVGGSYKQITQKHGGSYVSLKHDRPKINPFRLEKTKENLDFLYAFVRILLTNSRYHPTAEDDRQIWKAIKAANRISELKLPEHLMLALHQWVEGGQYGDWFDNAEDELSISRFQCFDFQGMELFPQVVDPLFFYIFNRISQIVYDPKNLGSFKQLWADEVWKFVSKHEQAKEFFLSAGLTWRKHNGGIGLVTQSAHSLQQAGMLEIVNEICPTKILLANPGADFSFYADTFKLNAKETEVFASLQKKRHALIKTDNHSKVVEIHVDPVATMYYANDPNNNPKRDALIAEHGSLEKAFAS